MTRDDIICWATEAGWLTWQDAPSAAEFIERFAAKAYAAGATAERERIIAKNAPEIERLNAHIKALEEAVQVEREACAKVCESMPWVSGKSLPSNVEMAAAIRARKG